MSDTVADPPGSDPTGSDLTGSDLIGGLLAVHAHPDDETIVTGATLAEYAARGVPVTLITCTRGECGEVIPPDLVHLEGDPPALGARRTRELAAAMGVLGVRDHHFLGAIVPGVPSGLPPRVYHDSGMAYGPGGEVVPAPTVPDGAFAREDLDEAAARLAEIVVARRPVAVVTYDPGGGYGHPDHVRTHQVTMAAVDRAAELGHDVPKVYWISVPETHERAGAARMAQRAPDPGWAPPDLGAPLRSMVVPDGDVTSRAGGEAWRRVKADALRAHATQVCVSDDEAAYALSDRVTRQLDAVEYYRLVRGRPAGPRDADGRETDLLAR